MRFYKTPWLVKQYFRGMEWTQPSPEKNIYLTFDDGPIPDVTEFVLACLAKYEAKASFFCVGDNIRKYPKVFEQVLKAGHSVGNHTYNHLNGWKTEDAQYCSNVQACQTYMDQHCPPIPGQKALFRPPYGAIKSSQWKALKANYRAIMWDVLTYDFDKNLSPETCLKKAIRHTRPGSIVLFHDSLKARKNMSYALPRYLAHFSKLGYSFSNL